MPLDLPTRARILAVRLDNIGDVIMLGPSLRLLGRALPDAHLTLLTSPAGSQVAPLLPWVDDVRIERALWQDASERLPFDPAREIAFIERLQAGAYDAAFIFTSFSQTPFPAAYAAYLAGIPIRVGHARDFGGGTLSHPMQPPPDHVHQVDRDLHLACAVGCAPGSPRLELRVPLEAQLSAERLLRLAGVDPSRPFVVLAPAASCPARTYSAERFQAAMRMLLDRTGLPLLVTGHDRDRATCEALTAGLEGLPVVSLAGQTSLPDLAGLISRAALVVANDSGPMHLADAFETPMVILFSGTDLESQWRPRHAPTILLRRPTSCSPCYAMRCPRDLECLDVSPLEVAEACLQLLRSTATSCPETLLEIPA